MGMLLRQMMIPVRLRLETRGAEEAAELGLPRRRRPVRAVRRRASASGRASVSVRGSRIGPSVSRLPSVVVRRRRPL